MVSFFDVGVLIVGAFVVKVVEGIIVVRTIVVRVVGVFGIRVTIVIIILAAIELLCHVILYKSLLKIPSIILLGVPPL